MDISTLPHGQSLPPPPQGDYMRDRSGAVVGVSAALATGTTARRKVVSPQHVWYCDNYMLFL